MDEIEIKIKAPKNVLQIISGLITTYTGMIKLMYSKEFPAVLKIKSQIDEQIK